MKKFDVKMTEEVEVTFSEPEALKAYFIDGTWKESFFNLADLEELAGHIVYAFNNTNDVFVKNSNTGDWYYSREIEGFGCFDEVKTLKGTYRAEFGDEVKGYIEVKIKEELHISYAEEI